MAGKLRKIPNFVLINMETLHEERVHKGLTRQALAVRMRSTIETIGKYERMVIRPSRESYNKLAQIFNWQLWL